MDANDVLIEEISKFVESTGKRSEIEEVNANVNATIEKLLC